MLDLFEITLDFVLNIIKPRQDLFDVTSNVLLEMREILITSKPDVVLLKVDTTISMATSLAEFYLQIRVGAC